MAVCDDFHMHLFTSADGIHWRPRGRSGWTMDRTTFFYNPFRKIWVFSIRDELIEGTRARRYWEARDFLRDVLWEKGEPPVWTGAERPRFASLTDWRRQSSAGDPNACSAR